MANTALSLVGLDFDSLRNNLVTFLKGQTQFSDLNFEGSNISVLLDLLAYNTHINAYYLNMIAGEMFLDSAQLYDSVVSHAKELNYLPRSRMSSKATVDIVIVPTASVPAVVVPKGTSFTTKVGSNNYTFTTDQNIVVTSSNGSFVASDVTLYEGTYTTENFVINTSDSDQKITISSDTVDVTSVTVDVYEDNAVIPTSYSYSTSLFGLDQSSKVFFLQAGSSKKYDVVFGDGVTGARPKNNSIVRITYRNSSGTDPEGASAFNVDSTIDGHSNVSVIVSQVAIGGAFEEDITSIRYNAPRYFQTQERAVTATDYETILRSRFPEITAISAYGGETVVPPQYGKVFISVDISGADGVPDNKKEIYRDYIVNRTPLTIDPVFVNPDFLYVSVVSDVHYNVNVTSKLSSDIKSLAHAAIESYNNSVLNKFNATLYYSKLIQAIDNADASIVGNDTYIRVTKRFTPTFNTNQNITIDFGIAIDDIVDNMATEHSQSVYHAVESSIFTHNGEKCILEDDGDGAMWISALDKHSHMHRKKAGTINYITGTIALQEFNVSGAENGQIKIYVRPSTKNITASKNTILTISNEDVVVNAIGGVA